jgi:hypothetical protein
MEDPPVCRANLCKLCHGDFKAEYQKRTKAMPFYARPTATTMRREIATLLSSSRRAVDETPKSSSRLGLEDFPTEVRLQIYRACLQSRAGVPIAGWVKGGGFHADRPVASYQYPKRLFMYATYAFDPVILRLNRRIHVEAQHEIYKHISATICIVDLPTQLLQLKYWLCESPLRFIRAVELPIAILTHRGDPLSTKVLPNVGSVGHLRRLGEVFARAPNLRKLSIVAVFYLYSPLDASVVLHRILTEDRWLKRLAMITSSLPATCRSTLVIKVSSRQSHHALDVLKVEKGIVAFISSNKAFDEVHQFSTSVVNDTGGGLRRGMPLQNIALG